MSHENVELVRRRFDAFNRGDLAALIELTDPGAVWWDRSDDPAGAPHRGRDACMRHVGEILEEVELQAQPEELVDVGDRVVADVRLIGRGRASSAAFEEHEFHVFTLRAGKVTDIREYRDRAEAFEVVGHSELGMSHEIIELAHQAADAFNRRDIDAYLALVDDEIQYTSRLAPMEGGYRGHAGIRRFWADLLGVWPDITAHLVELSAVGDVTVGALELRGRGVGSDVPLQWTVWQGGRWRDGKIISWGSFETRAQAFEAVGLSGQDARGS